MSCLLQRQKDIGELLGLVSEDFGDDNTTLHQEVIFVIESKCSKYRYTLDLSRPNGVLIVTCSNEVANYGWGEFTVYYRWGERAFRVTNVRVSDEASKTLERIGNVWQKFCTPLSVRFLSDSGGSSP